MSREQRKIRSLGQVLVLIPVFVFLGIFIILPVWSLLSAAFASGPAVWLENLLLKDTRSALGISFVTVLVVLPLNIIFGLAASWFLVHHAGRWKSVLLALIDLPFAVSPVIAGLIYILLLGKHGYFGPALETLGLQVIFAPPALVLTSLFLTLPLIVRELVPVMDKLGSEEEEAALLLGAGGWDLFFRVSLPKLKIALLYGITLSSARAAGEFGAASVVSGLLRGRTVTLPLQIDIFYSEYMSRAAYAAASIFFVFAILTLISKTFLGKRLHQEEIAIVQKTPEGEPSGIKN